MLSKIRIPHPVLPLMFVGLAVSAATVASAGEDTPAGSEDTIKWRSDLRSSAIESSRTRRPMLLKFTAPWCGYCHKLKRVTFRDPQIAEQVGDNFIPVLVDADSHPELMKALEVEGLPTMVVVSPELKVLAKIVGYKTPAQLRPQFAKIIEQTRRPIRLTGEPVGRN